MSNTLLLTYIRDNEISDNMLYKDDAMQQMIYMRDTIGHDLCQVPMFVVSTHVSKSIELPVYGFVLRNGVKIIARDNFYGWMVSVVLPYNLPLGYFDMDIFSDNEKFNYIEGFKSQWIYDPYDPGSKTRSKFTVGINNDYILYMFIYKLIKAFPDMTFSDNNRSESEIAGSIKGIYMCNDLGNKHGWEILWYTYYQLDNIEPFNICQSNDPHQFAERLMKHPKALDTFLMEEYMFNTNF